MIKNIKMSKLEKSFLFLYGEEFTYLSLQYNHLMSYFDFKDFWVAVRNTTPHSIKRLYTLSSQSYQHIIGDPFNRIVPRSSYCMNIFLARD